LNDYCQGLLEGMAFAEALLNKHLPENDTGPACDAIDEIDTVMMKILYGVAIRSVPDKVALLPTELPVEDAVKPGDEAGPGDVSVEWPRMRRR